jgi:putative ABC transport system permease protein
MAQRRLNMLMLALFGVLGLMICAVGVSGLLAFIVSRQTREIGIRMVLGATRGQMIRMVLTRAGGLVAAGVAIGGASAWFLSRSATAFLFGLDAHDLRAFAAAGITVIIAALVASLIPASRAATVDPTVALRAE